MLSAAFIFCSLSVNFIHQHLTCWSLHIQTMLDAHMTVMTPSSGEKCTTGGACSGTPVHRRYIFHFNFASRRFETLSRPRFSRRARSEERIYTCAVWRDMKNVLLRGGNL